MAIICEDSDQLINLVEQEEGVDVRNWTVPAEKTVDLKTFKTVPAENPVDLKTLKTAPVENSVDVKIFKTVPSANSAGVKFFNSSPSNLKRSTEQPFPHKIFSSDQKTSVSEIVESTTRENKRSTDSEGWYIKPGTTSTSGWYIKSNKTDKKKSTTASTWSLASLSEWYYGN